MIAGMFRIGNTNPERMKVGSMVAITASIKATCCVPATVEMSSPIPSDPMRKTRVTMKSHRKLPLTATSKRRYPATSMMTVESRAMSVYGTVLPRIN